MYILKTYACTIIIQNSFFFWNLKKKINNSTEKNV